MSRKQNAINVYDGVFDRNSPRPPVPGEERVHCVSDWGPMDYPYKTSTPAPRKSYNYIQNDDSKSIARHDRQNDTRTPDNISSPACIRWATSLHCLLEDPDGVDLFKEYLQGEGKPQADVLDFWFACEGLRKQTEPDRVQQLVKVIYKRFFMKSALPISEEYKKEVGRRIKSPSGIDSPIVFDEAQAQVERLINVTTYPNFIKSDKYLQYIQSVQNPTGSCGEFSSESSSSSSNKDLASLACGVGPLPIIHEDMEFNTHPSAAHGHTPGTGCMSTGYHTPNLGGPIRLTKDMLLATQKNRAMDVRPKPEAFAADDGRSLHRSSRRKAAMEARHVRENAALNRETHMHQTLIPRTQRLDKQQCQPQHPEQFAAILIQKLDVLRREQDTQDTLERKLKESDSMSSLNEKTRINEAQSRELANAIREKLQLEDDNDQDILDQHVSRVFSDQTPHARSPGVVSPRAHSPTRNRYQGAYRPRRKEKDGFSTFSSDSGNVHDFTEGSEHKMMVKSKSMPEYADERFIRGSVNRSFRSSSKKTLTDFTDSGVSVVSDSAPVGHGGPPKEHRVLAWLMDSERGSRTSSYTHSEMSSKHRGHRSSSATSPNANRHRKGYGSRSNSLERSSASSTLGPAQPFVADPSMPPLPQPNTVIQLEEARRRLMEDDGRTRSSRQRLSSKHYPEMTQSSQSTLRKSTRGPRQSTTGAEDVTTVVFSFCDEQFPYRTKIPGRQVTLKQFKEYLPKKGNYRYFFKTECEELDNQVIQEEVSNDADILPLWEGRINAQVKPID